VSFLVEVHLSVEKACANGRLAEERAADSENDNGRKRRALSGRRGRRQNFRFPVKNAPQNRASPGTPGRSFSSKRTEGRASHSLLVAYSAFQEGREGGRRRIGRPLFFVRLLSSRRFSTPGNLRRAMMRNASLRWRERLNRRTSPPAASFVARRGRESLSSEGRR